MPFPFRFLILLIQKRLFHAKTQGFLSMKSLFAPPPSFYAFITWPWFFVLISPLGPYILETIKMIPAWATKNFSFLCIFQTWFLLLCFCVFFYSIPLHSISFHSILLHSILLSVFIVMTVVVVLLLLKLEFIYFLLKFGSFSIHLCYLNNCLLAYACTQTQITANA